MRCFTLFVLAATICTACHHGQSANSPGKVHSQTSVPNTNCTPTDLLTAHQYTSLVVEIQYMEGYKPDPAALSNLRRFLQQHLHKPSGIYFSERQVAGIADSVWSKEQVLSFPAAHRTVYNSGRQLSLYIVYTSGYYQDKRILGHSFAHSSIVIYGRAVKANQHRFSIPTQATIETRLLLHELGHLLGLVNKGTAMRTNHDDSLHENHCNNPNCVMYWNVPIQPAFGPLRLKKPAGLDSACLADLRALGGY